MEQEQVKGDKIINHIRNIKLLQAIYKGNRFFIDCFPTDAGSKCFPNSNFAVKEIELPNFDLYEEKLGYKWVEESAFDELIKENAELKKRVVETFWNHYKTHGGYTRLAAEFIEKLTGEKWERDKEYDDLKSENAELKQKVKQLQSEYMEVQVDLQNKIFKLEAQLNNEWISVEDRLPKFNDMFTSSVLGYDGAVMKVVGLYKNPNGTIVGYGTTQECFMRKVTHWQPLPAPPKVQTEIQEAQFKKEKWMKLSKPQQKVVDILKSNYGSYIKPSPYYHWQHMIINGIKSPENSLWKPTLDALIKKGILIKRNDGGYILK